MQMRESFYRFVRDHADDDVSELLLSAGRYPDVDVKTAAVQIRARARIKDKLPSWHRKERLFYPSVLSVEQCSSEPTARYKQQLVRDNDVLCDLTGGLGVDAFFFSQKMRRVIYVEKNEAYCEAARYNMPLLGADGIDIIQDDAVEMVMQKKLPAVVAAGISRGIAPHVAAAGKNVRVGDPRINDANVFYIDPSRRGAGDKRTFALRDCEPDLTMLMPILLENGRKVIAKLSPMLDITAVLSQLSAVREVHILSVKNECKELLIVAEMPDRQEDGFPPYGSGADMQTTLSTDIRADRTIGYRSNPQIFCINFSTSALASATITSTFTSSTATSSALASASSVAFSATGLVQTFQYTLHEEQQAVAPFAAALGRYLYEPNASVLKAGAFKTVAVRFGLDKLHADSHLYTSGRLLNMFPGRCFEIEEIIPFSSRVAKRLSADIPQANIAVRNFPLSVDELRKRTHIADGSDIYLFATTLADNQKVLVKCSRVVYPADVTFIL